MPVPPPRSRRALGPRIAPAPRPSSSRGPPRRTRAAYIRPRLLGRLAGWRLDDASLAAYLGYLQHEARRRAGNRRAGRRRRAARPPATPVRRAAHPPSHRGLPPPDAPARRGQAGQVPRPHRRGGAPPCSPPCRVPTRVVLKYGSGFLPLRRGLRRRLPGCIGLWRARGFLEAVIQSTQESGSDLGFLRRI